ncbi:MAG: HU family DNA-binding protein, partial [Alloprevotella sp.]
DTSDQCTLAIQGFGSFEVKKKMERIVVNPATKQRKLIPPKLVMGFKPSAVLKEKLK